MKFAVVILENSMNILVKVMKFAAIKEYSFNSWEPNLNMYDTTGKLGFFCDAWHTPQAGPTSMPSRSWTFWLAD
jgi:hypothetical protein